MGDDPVIFPETREEIASLLDYDIRKLDYLLYGLPESQRYHTFKIPKRNGTEREISAPASAIKTIQRRLSDHIYKHYKVKSCAHGFVKKRDVVSNASRHRNQRWVVNVDLKDFFPTINFGRVRGAFLGRPFNCSEKVATLLAQICCYQGKLPQGAPTSPIVSNIVCRQLDNRLLDFAKENKLTYTRYADDITFSTNLKEVPMAIGRLDDDGGFLIGDQVRAIIESCGFQINEDKVHCCSRYHRQMVTGLVANKIINVPRDYVKRIRCMLHAYEKFGLAKAAKEHFKEYDKRKTDFPELTFRKILAGRIGYLGHVKGKSDRLYLKLAARMKRLDPEAPLTIPLYTGEERIIVYGEGKTDTMHLQAAFEAFRKKGCYADMSVKFFRYRDDEEINNKKLFDFCSSRSLAKKDEKIEICLFDRDDNSFSSKKVEVDGKPRDWGRGVYSFLLPRVAHRAFEEICIEHYYLDADLLKTDSYGRRVYLSNEFDASTGLHNKAELSYSCKDRLKCHYPRIIDQDVYSSKGKNVALSKMAFARAVLARTAPFDKMDFSAFSAVFDIIEGISKAN